MRHVVRHALSLLLSTSLAGLCSQDMAAQISVDAAVHTTASYHHFTSGRTLGTNLMAIGARAEATYRFRVGLTLGIDRNSLGIGCPVVSCPTVSTTAWFGLIGGVPIGPIKLMASAEVGGANWNHAWQRVRRGVVYVEFPQRSAFRLRLGLGRQLDHVDDDNTVAVLGIVLRLR